MPAPVPGRATAPLWSAAEAAAAARGTATRDWQAAGVSIDSRTLQPGDLFVALLGPRHDGHDHVGAALAAGAAAAVVAHAPAGLAADAPLLKVADTMAALTALGQAARARSRARFVAVTGSVGKTGTKEALRLALGATAPTYATTGNLNNQWGVPLSLARLPRETAFGVFELGMNHAGEIRALTTQVRPHLAIVTTVEATHLEFFASVAAIADAKAEIFEGMDRSGIAVLNRDNAHFERLAARARTCGVGRIVGFGRDAGAEARLLDCSLHAACSAVTARILGEPLDYSLGMPGLHWIMNSLAVLAAVRLLDGDLGAGAAALARLRPLRGRGERRQIALRGGRFTLIDESYNASPASMLAAIAVLGHARPGDGGRRVAVLGDMLELGADAPALHAGLADALAGAAELVFTAGPLTAALHAALPADRRGPHAANAAQLVAAVAAAVRPGDIVLVKGSLGSRMAQIVEALAALDQAGAALPRAANGN